jgi:PAS domain S-box-containing protein
VSNDGEILSLDERFSHLLRLTPMIVHAHSMGELVAHLQRTGDDMALRIAKLLESAEDDFGEIVSVDNRVIEWSRSRLRGSAGGSIFAFRDVENHRVVMQALRDAEVWLEMFAVHTGGVILELDEAGCIVGTWSSDAEILMMPQEALQGRTLTEAVGHAQAAEFEARIRDVLATGEPASFEYTLDTNDGRRVFAMNAARFLDEASDGNTRVSVLVRDVTEQIRMQTQLVQAERLASVGLLSAGIAHEINNPLAYILLNLQRVRRGIRTLGATQHDPASATLATELEQSVDMMVEGAQRVQEIVRDLRRFSRSDQDALRVPIDVRNVLVFSLAMTAFEVERRARVVREFRPVPLVLGNEVRVGQLFLNLILNAAQAIADPDPSRHEIRLITSTDERGNAVVEVHDTGVGIPPANVRKIFDPFFTTKATGGGTGLGLAICHGIARWLGGDITADSTLGAGTVFRVVLPPAPREAHGDDASV